MVRPVPASPRHLSHVGMTGALGATSVNQTVMIPTVGLGKPDVGCCIGHKSSLATNQCNKRETGGDFLQRRASFPFIGNAKIGLLPRQTSSPLTRRRSGQKRSYSSVPDVIAASHIGVTIALLRVGFYLLPQPSRATKRGRSRARSKNLTSSSCASTSGRNRARSSPRALPEGRCVGAGEQD